MATKRPKSLPSPGLAITLCDEPQEIALNCNAIQCYCVYHAIVARYYMCHHHRHHIMHRFQKEAINDRLSLIASFSTPYSRVLFLFSGTTGYLQCYRHSPLSSATASFGIPKRAMQPVTVTGTVTVTTGRMVWPDPLLLLQGQSATQDGWWLPVRATGRLVSHISRVGGPRTGWTVREEGHKSSGLCLLAS